MNRFKRICALAGAVLLLGMYLVVFILGMAASPATEGTFMAAVACTIIVPCLLYGMILVARVLDRRNQNQGKKEGPGKDTKNRKDTKKQKKIP